MLPPNPTQLYLVSIRFQCKISLVTSFTLTKKYYSKAVLIFFWNTLYFYNTSGELPDPCETVCVHVLCLDSRDCYLSYSR